MSTHDRGAFGALLAEAKALGAPTIKFKVWLGDETENRWQARVGRSDKFARGRTGEEALRGLVEKLRNQG